MAYPIKIMYIEGFSPGPGLPFPLLRSPQFDVITSRMPYTLWDHLRNPYVWGIIINTSVVIWLSTKMATFKLWGYLAVCLVECCGVFIFLKRLAVGYCRIWKGPTLLIAPAGEQMWQHAGRLPPSLDRSRIAATAAVVTVQGAADEIVTLNETRRLHRGANEGQCRLLEAAGEGHFLELTVTSVSLLRWCRELIANSASLARV